MTIYPVPKPGVREKVRPEGLKRSRMKSRGSRTKKSGGHLFPEWIDERFRAWVREQPCVVFGRQPVESGLWAVHQCPTYSERQACHVKSRGSGGVDKANLYAACWVIHDEQHRLGIRSFERRWGVNLKAQAEKLWNEYGETLE